MIAPLSIKIEEHNSTAYWEMINLRSEILRIPLGLSFTKEELALENNQYHFAAYCEEKLVACLVLAPKKESIKMRQVAVASTMQKKGIGRSLVLFAERWSKENGYKTIYCHARDNAIPFYDSLHYKKIGELFIEVELPHYKLQKML